MLQIFFGENLVASRNAYVEAMQKVKSSGVKDVVAFNGKKVTLVDLQQAVESQSLFGGDRLICLENLVSRPRSKAKDELISYLIDNTDSAEVVIWEGKNITPAQKKKFSSTQLNEFKLSKQLFSLLDALKPGSVTKTYTLYLKVLEQDGEGLIFAMLARQVRLLLQAKDGGKLKGAPWQVTKLKQQAGYFTMQQLLKIHNQLLQIDIELKTGGLLSLRQNLDRLILTI